MEIIDLKKGFILVSVILSLIFFSIASVELYKQNSYAIMLTTKEKAFRDTIHTMRQVKQQIYTFPKDCVAYKEVETERFKNAVFFDYEYFKSCSSQDPGLFLNTDGFVIVHLHTTDKLNNLSSFERFYWK